MREESRSPLCYTRVYGIVSSWHRYVLFCAPCGHLVDASAVVWGWANFGFILGSYRDATSLSCQGFNVDSGNGGL